MEEINDLNYGIYTDVRYKSRRSTIIGSDYIREDKPRNITDIIIGDRYQRSRMRLGEAENQRLRQLSPQQNHN
jgi:hypothetical protein